MTAEHPGHIALTAPLARCIDHTAAGGEQASAGEVIRTALRQLVEREAPCASIARGGERHTVPRNPFNRHVARA